MIIMSKKLINKDSKPLSKNCQEIEEILELVTRFGVSEFEYEKDKTKIRFRFGSPSASVSHNSVAPVAAPPVLTAAVESKKPETPVANPAHKTVLSPFVGIFYRSPRPKAELYVKEGQIVKKGQVLCIVEAMKLMNEIEAEFPGKLISTLVENGQPVEFGEPLFVIDTSDKWKQTANQNYLKKYS